MLFVNMITAEVGGAFLDQQLGDIASFLEYFISQSINYRTTIFLAPDYSPPSYTRLRV